MLREQLQSFQSWFNGYVKSFYSGDTTTQAGIILKENHTRRVCRNTVRSSRTLDRRQVPLLFSMARHI